MRVRGPVHDRGSNMRTMVIDNRRNVANMMGRIERHFSFVLRHMTPRKIGNAVLCIFEMKTRRPALRSHPIYLRIEVSPLCNLRCPGCVIGGGLDGGAESSPEHRLQGLMKYPMFESSVAGFPPWLFKVNLYDEGEPLLNKELFKMIEFLSRNNVSTCISTNFSYTFSDATLEEMLDCGLEHLVIPLEGATQESYSRYRKGGDLHLVIDNIRRLMTLKRSRKDRSPLKVEIQFLDFGDNGADREPLRRIAEDLGVWRLLIKEGCSRQGWKGKRFTGAEEERRRKGCYEAWMDTTINSIGEMGTCDYGEDHGIPNIGLAEDYHSMDLRNHPSLVRLRGSFRDESVPLDAICCHCSLF